MKVNCSQNSTFKNRAPRAVTSFSEEVSFIGYFTSKLVNLSYLIHNQIEFILGDRSLICLYKLFALLTRCWCLVFQNSLKKKVYTKFKRIPLLWVKGNKISESIFISVVNSKKKCSPKFELLKCGRFSAPFLKLQWKYLLRFCHLYRGQSRDGYPQSNFSNACMLWTQLCPRWIAALYAEYILCCFCC